MSDVLIGGLPASGAPFRIGVVLSKTFDLLTGNFGKFALLTLVPMIPLLLLVLVALARPPSAPGFSALGAITGLLTVVLGILAQAMTLYGAFQAMRRQPFTIGQSLQIGLGRALPVIGVALVVGLATGLASLLLLVPGLILMCMFYVAVPVCVIERPGVFASAGRSAALTKGYRWSIFGLLLLVWVVAIVVGIVLGLLAGLGGGVVGALVNFAWQIVSTAFGAVLAAVVYHDLRVAKEGIDIESLANVFD